MAAPRARPHRVGARTSRSTATRTLRADLGLSGRALDRRSPDGRDAQAGRDAVRGIDATMRPELARAVELGVDFRGAGPGAADAPAPDVSAAGWARFRGAGARNAAAAGLRPRRPCMRRGSRTSHGPRCARRRAAAGRLEPGPVDWPWVRRCRPPVRNRPAPEGPRLPARAIGLPRPRRPDRSVCSARNRTAGSGSPRVQSTTFPHCGQVDAASSGVHGPTAAGDAASYRLQRQIEAPALTCIASRPVPSQIWWRQLNRVGDDQRLQAPRAARAGSRASSAICIDTS